MSAEQTPEPLQPFPLNAAGRLAITSLSVPDLSMQAWRMVDGLSLGKSETDAAIYAGIDPEKAQDFASNTVRRKFWGQGPFAIRAGIELGQIVQPYNPDLHVTLPADQYTLLDLVSRGVTQVRLISEKEYGFTKNSYSRIKLGLLDALQAKDMNHATRRSFRAGVFPAVDIQQARQYYANLFRLKRMRTFLHQAYPVYPFESQPDQAIQNSLQNLRQAWGLVELCANRSFARGLQDRIRQFSHWLDGMTPDQLAEHHRISKGKLQANRRALASAVGGYVSLDLLLAEEEA